MGKLIVSDAVANGVQGVKVLTPVYGEEYKKLQEDANERIRQARIQEAQAYIKAKNFVAL